MKKQIETAVTAYKTPEVVTYTKEELSRLVGPIIGTLYSSSIHGGDYGNNYDNNNDINDINDNNDNS